MLLSLSNQNTMKWVETVATRGRCEQSICHFVWGTENCRPRCPRSLRRWYMAACLMGSRVRIPPGAWMFVYNDCWVLCS